MTRLFLVLRLVLLCFLGFSDALGLFFAVWNIMMFKDLGTSVKPEPIFVIANAVLVLILLSFAAFDFLKYRIGVSQVMFELCWIVVCSMLHLASAVDNTTFGPPYLCYHRVSINLCASSMFLVVLTWISSSILVLYLLILTVSIAAHREVQNLWRSSMYDIPWYLPPTHPTLRPQPQRKHKTRESATWEGHPVWSAHEDEDIQEVPLTPPLFPPSAFTASVKDKTLDLSSASQIGSIGSQGRRPPWAKSLNLRRGVDQPFAVRIPPTPFGNRSGWSATTMQSPPRPPPKLHTTGDLGPFADHGEYVVDLSRDTVALPEIPPSRPLTCSVFTSWDGSQYSPAAPPTRRF